MLALRGVVRIEKVPLMSQRTVWHSGRLAGVLYSLN